MARLRGEPRAHLAVDLQRVALHPVVLHQTVLTYMPYRGAGHLERRLRWLQAHEAVVLAGNAPARRHAVAFMVLEGLHDVELEVVDARQEPGDPLLEFGARMDFDAAGSDGEILGDQILRSLRIPRLPDGFPEMLDDFNGAFTCHGSIPHLGIDTIGHAGNESDKRII